MLLIRFRADLGNQPARLLIICPHARSGLLWLHGPWFQMLHALPGISAFDRLDDLGMYTFEDRARQVDGRHHDDPAAILVTRGARFRDGGCLRKLREPRIGSHRQQALPIAV